MAAVTQEFVKVNGVYHIKGRSRETLEVIAHHRPANIPGKSLIALRLTQPPNAATPPHTHAGGTALGLTIDGQVLNQMNRDEPQIAKTGECWYEAPGCHHVRGENASKTETASFFAVLLVDDDVVREGYEGVVVIDEEVKKSAKEALGLIEVRCSTHSCEHTYLSIGIYNS